MGSRDGTLANAGKLSIRHSIAYRPRLTNIRCTYSLFLNLFQTTFLFLRSFLRPFVSLFLSLFLSSYLRFFVSSFIRFFVPFLLHFFINSFLTSFAFPSVLPILFHSFFSSFSSFLFPSVLCCMRLSQKLRFWQTVSIKCFLIHLICRKTLLSSYVVADK